MASSTAEGAVWAAQDTTPSAIQAALRQLLEERHKEDQAFVPARVLNLICIVDREWRGEIENRLERVGRFHPSRTVLISVDPGRTTIDAVASMGGAAAGKPGEIHVGAERVEVTIGEEHLQRLET